MSERNRIEMIGVGEEGARGLTATTIEIIRGAELLVGGERLLSMFPDGNAERFVLKGGLSQALEYIDEQRRQRRVVVLASGDPLFFGIAGIVTRKLGANAVNLHPQVSSLQLAFARLGEAWQDAGLESVHGRPMKGLAQRIDGQKKVALLTDETNNPAEIAKYLLHYGMTEYDAFVGENLGGEEERYGHWSLAEMAESTFSPLNVVILLRRSDAPPSRKGFGFEDEEFSQRKPDKGLITKKEIRVLSLSELKLSETSIVWDIGAGSGSVAVECARLASRGEVYAIEKNEDDLANVIENQIKFRTDFTVVHGKAPQGLEHWPDPDAVFIGGSGGELKELIALCVNRLRPEGRIVINAATIETLATAQEALKESGCVPRISLVQVSRSKPILHMTRFEGLNPIYIITGAKGG
jgi:precorrin-6Y C5,15-methyltransferase (decarboxylating)